MSPLAFLIDADALVSDAGLPFDGVKEMLDGLRSAGYEVEVVLDGTPREEWAEKEARLGLGPFTSITVESERVVHIIAPGAADANVRKGVRVGVGLWVDGDGADGGEGAGAEWRFARPADITRTFAAWC
jgi:hypothetical protein